MTAKEYLENDQIEEIEILTCNGESSELLSVIMEKYANEKVRQELCKNDLITRLRETKTNASWRRLIFEYFKK